MKCALFILVATGLLGASQPNTLDSRIRADLRGLSSPTLDARIAAFYDIVHAGLSTNTDSEFPVKDGVLAIAHASLASRTRLVGALTSLLTLETDLVSAGKAPATEEYSNYYGNVISAVSALGDPSSVHALMRCLNTGGMAQDALASFGEPALMEARKALPTADPETRSNLFRLFMRMAEPQSLSNLKSVESRVLLVDVLLAGAKDGEPFVREASVAGLSHFSCPEAVDALMRLAAGDSFGVVDPDGTTRYPVREAAAGALRVRGLGLQRLQ